MSDQPSLFVGAPHNGIETSIAAAVAALPNIGPDEHRIMAYIHYAGPRTCDEVEAGIGMRHQTASARINGLVEKGLLKRTEEKRRTRTGREAFVYSLGSGNADDGRRPTVTRSLRAALEAIVALSEKYPPCDGEPWDDVKPCKCDASNSGDMEWHGSRSGMASAAEIAREALHEARIVGVRA